MSRKDYRRLMEASYALAEASEAFAKYAQSHSLKGTLEADKKAATNGELHMKMDEVCTALEQTPLIRAVQLVADVIGEGNGLYPPGDEIELRAGLTDATWEKYESLIAVAQRAFVRSEGNGDE